jgi:hypothetical protein
MSSLTNLLGNRKLILAFLALGLTAATSTFAVPHAAFAGSGYYGNDNNEDSHGCGSCGSNDYHHDYNGCDYWCGYNHDDNGDDQEDDDSNGCDCGTHYYHYYWHEHHYWHKHYYYDDNDEDDDNGDDSCGCGNEYW